MEQEWLERRKRGLGGSDAPVVCGISPWKTPYQLYREKRGEVEGQAQDSEAMAWGRALEPVIRQRYCDQTGRVVTVPSSLLVHPSREWQIGNVDGLTDDGRVLEVKTARMNIGWGEPGTDEIPDHYRAQVQHYMIVTGLAVCDVAVLIGGSDYRQYEVPEDKELQAAITDAEAEFWSRVQNGNPPEARTFADLKAKFGGSSVAARIQATDEAREAISVLKRLKDLGKEEDAAKAVLMALMGAKDTLVDGEKVLATWKAGKPGKRFDLDLFRSENRNLADHYTRETQPARRFLVK